MKSESETYLNDNIWVGL
uniref:Uncharacterized protein n=1 Tax=Lepeophtheirus salmonis TaxID=72036 RepID=A0A0K2UXP2_LEPSM